MYGAIEVGRPVQYGKQIAVRSVEDLAYLIKESEGTTGTGQLGREFVAALFDGQARYRIYTTGEGFKVRRADTGSENDASFLLLPEELTLTPIGQAMSDGRLFCQALEADYADWKLV
jgi:hypothetical protein